MLLLGPEQEKKDDKDGDGNEWGLLVLLGIIFLPAVVVGYSFYLLLRWGRQKLSVITTIILIYEIVLAIVWASTNALNRFLSVFNNLSTIMETWTEMIPAMLLVNLMLAGPFGFVLSFVQVQQIKNNPHKLKLQGSWLYNFRYRRTPFELFKRNKNIQKLKDGSFASEEKAPLGLNEDNDTVVYRYMSEAVKQTLISGSAGSGKTITMLSMILNDIKNQMPVVIVDFKRSPELASKTAAWAHEYGCNFYHFVNGEPDSYDVPKSPGQATYDPLISGGAGKADMVLGMREYDNAAAVYKSYMRQILQILFSTLRLADRSKTKSIDWNHGHICQIASAVNGNLDELAGACEGTDIQEDAEYLALKTRNRTDDLTRQLGALQGQMRTLMASEYGRWLRPAQGSRTIDLYQLTKEPGNVILFSLNADSEKDFSRYMGSLILADLNAVSARRRNAGDRNQVNVYIDEFQAVPPTAVTSLLEKSRESKIAMTLSSQSFEQIIAAAEHNGEAYLLGIMDTCSNFIVHSGATEDSATRLSKISGKHMVTVYSQANNNRTFLFSSNWHNRRNQTVQSREEERWIVPTQAFMNLSAPTSTNNYRATAIVINKSPDDPRYRNHEGGALVRKVWMIPDDKVIANYYEPKFDSIGHDESDTVSVSLEKTDSALNTLPGPEQQNMLSSEESEHPLAALYTGNSSMNEYDTIQMSEEDEDGGFGFESLDDELDPDMRDVLSISVDKPLPVVRSSQTAKNTANASSRTSRSALETSSFNALFNDSNYKPEIRQTRPDSHSTKSIPMQEDEEEALPDLHDLM